MPHTEIARLYVNGQETDFGHIARPHDAVAVEPVSAPFDVFTPTMLRPEPLRAIRFVVDVNVGKLATLLRMAGFNTAYQNHLRDRELAEIARREKRILLTKDTNLLKRKSVVFGHLVRAVRPKEQLAEVIELFDLADKVRPLSRCLRCNLALVPVEKKAILHRLEPLTRKYYDAFHQCPGCQKIYWAGSHKDRMQDYLQVMSSLAPRR